MRPHALVLLLATLLLTGCPSRGPDPWEENAGVYTARFPAADAQERIVTLWLDEGGTARLEQVYVGKARLPVDEGRWSATGTDITVTLADASEPIVFRRVGKELLPESWDKKRYGSEGLILQRRWPR
jgi:hypothetical protein